MQAGRDMSLRRVANFASIPPRNYERMCIHSFSSLVIGSSSTVSSAVQLAKFVERQEAWSHSWDIQASHFAFQDPQAIHRKYGVFQFIFSHDGLSHTSWESALRIPRRIRSWPYTKCVAKIYHLELDVLVIGSTSHSRWYCKYSKVVNLTVRLCHE